ncbi:putative [Fe] hydrogenase large subunit HymC [Oscillibacter sp. CAG:241]|nr:MAG: ferredoxin [Oscillibacter sp.]CDB26459.1 putative [Fe] hydrogenase large subunit HymC [Oscillibacter sp. CAG:241]HBL64289.1 ferredoxin [Oscillibacter sp.]HCV06293.1 ferredoxin [Oscillibacter sp.]
MAKGIMIVDGQRVPFDGEKNVLSVIRKAGIDMPTFCYYSELSVHGACRMCIVENVKTGKIDASCSMEPRDGLEIRTNTARLLRHRRMILELMLASHDCSCTTCAKSGNCRLQALAQRFGVSRVRFPDTRERYEQDNTSPAIFRDPNKCILCGDCVRVCEELQGQGILNYAHRGSELQVMPAFDRKLADTKCVGCGQCAAVCTTGAITVKNQIGQAWQALHDPKNRVVVQIAPAVRVALGEEFGLPAGENVMDRLVKALKLMGVEEVYDTDFAADMTTISESQEFLERLKAGGPFPMFTSCCPAWVKYLELNDPKYLRNISSCKSPMEMFAAVLRDKYQAKDAADGRRTYHMAIMPCTAKKMEAARAEFTRDGQPDVDLVITTRELVDMIREAGIQLTELEPEAPDLPFGLGSGAAVIYGVTGGVAEAVVRYCLPDKSNNALQAIRVTDLRGDGAIREVNLTVEGQELHIAIVNGLSHAKELIADVEAGKRFYHLVEVMTCQGGCVGGAGQPYGLTAAKKRRGAGLYEADATAMFKGAEKNPIVTRLLDEYGHERCHELLHVRYGE